MTRKYKVIRFSSEHIHIVHNHGTHLHVQCVLSRKWNRCTAGDLSVEDWKDLPRCQDRSYYDGTLWARATVDDSYCYQCDERDDQSSADAQFAANVFTLADNPMYSSIDEMFVSFVDYFTDEDRR